MLLVILLVAQSPSLSAIAQCQAAPGNQYEEVFCQLSSSRYSYSLPSLQEFRRNPRTVQYLLLKRAASREGIALAKPKELKAASPMPVERKPGPLAARASRASESAKKPSSSERAKKQLVAVSRPHECRYTARRISCGNRQYTVQTNRNNSELTVDALSDNNNLHLPLKQVGEPTEAWLARAYSEYIAALLRIGLAGSSSTYSAFAHTYFELERSGTDFATRIQQSFDLLKKDKRTLAVSKRYPKSAPVADDCEWLHSAIIACNSAGNNWVYTLD